MPRGHQEIAWIAPATSGESWERLVAALKLLQNDSTLQVDYDKAFLPLTADVPEVAFHLAPRPPPDGAIDPAAHDQRLVRRIDDGIDRQRGDIRGALQKAMGRSFRARA